MSRLRLLWFQSETTPKHLVRVVLTRVFYNVFTRLGLRLLRRIFVIALRVSACHQKNTDSYQQEILSVPCIQAARPRSFGLWANHIFACTGVAVLKSKKIFANSNANLQQDYIYRVPFNTMLHMQQYEPLD